MVMVFMAAAASALAPPAHQVLTEPVQLGAPGVRGVIHVHSDRSDGTGSVEEIAEAAARAGLRYVVVTDHGDGRRSPALPRYLSGVLCIDGMEISTDDGHVLALGIGRTPYRLAGDGRGVIEDIHRLGGTSIVAHPDSLKPELNWSDLNAPFDGWEWLNADSAWRDEGAATLMRTLATFWFRGPEALSLLLDRPTALDTWDTLTRQRPVVALAGTDAHSRIGIGMTGEPFEGEGPSVPLPTYAQTFGVFSVTLVGTSLSGRPVEDAAAVLQAIRRGRLYSTIDAIATPGTLRFSATSGAAMAVMGESLAASGPVTLTVESNAPASASVAIFKDGVAVQTTIGPTATREETVSPAIYRVEIQLPRAPGAPPVPWMVSNPIYVNPREATTIAPSSPVSVAPIYRDGPTTGWELERSVRSAAALGVVATETGTQADFRFALGGTASEHPFAALAIPVPPAIADYSAIRVRARSARPMRTSIQLRVPSGAAGERWRASIFLDETLREITVPFSAFRAVAQPERTVPLAAVTTLLVVVDEVHAALGTSGEVWLDDIDLIRAAP
jgi:hypothetical protein